jgi:hypothetical protein
MNLFSTRIEFFACGAGRLTYVVGHWRFSAACQSGHRDWAVIVTSCFTISYMDSGLLGGGVAFELA